MTKEKIRPILYQDFHVLHQDVAEIVGSIDRDIQQMELAEEFNWHYVQGTADDYYGLIELLHWHLKNNRENISNQEIISLPLKKVR